MTLKCSQHTLHKSPMFTDLGSPKECQLDLGPHGELNSGLPDVQTLGV